MNQLPKKFIVSGGGTGGHIYPAIAIADEIKRNIPDAEILFVGAEGRMEMEKVPKAGYPIKGLPITGMSRKISLSLLMFPIKLIRSIVQARKIIKDFNPDYVIGTGGYASGPILYAATQFKTPILVQEQNSLAGKTNKRLAKKAAAICVAYKGMENQFDSKKIYYTGNPIRAEIFQNLPSRDEALAFFNLDPTKKTILSVGGSLGSRNMNNAWKNQIEQIKKDPTIQLVWQTGSADFKTINEDNAFKNSNISIHEFIYEMRMAYAIADVVVSRAGAIAISELCLIGKPVILIPLPWAAEDHQTKNAQALVEEQAAILIKDNEANEKLVPTVINLLNDKEKCIQMSQSIATLAKPNATKDIVQLIINP